MPSNTNKEREVSAEEVQALLASIFKEQEKKVLTPPQRSFVTAHLQKLPQGVHIDFEKCDHCGMCVCFCAEGFFKADKEDGHVSVVNGKSMEFCPGNWKCAQCILVCSQGAVIISKGSEQVSA